MKRREKKNHPKRFRGACISVAVSSLLILIFAHSSYLHFPKQIFAFWGDSRSVLSNYEKKFEMTRAPQGNLWICEIEFFENLRYEQIFTVTVNGGGIGSLEVRGKRGFTSFPSSMLRRGENSLRIVSSFPGQFRRVRIKNIYGYSSGILTGVIFPKENKSIEIRKWPSAPFFFPFLILLGVASFTFHFMLAGKAEPTSRFLRALNALRYGIPVLFLGILLFPLFTRLRIIISVQTTLFLFLLYFSLPIFPYFYWGLKRAAGRVNLRVSFPIGTLREKVKRIPKKGDRLSALLLFGFVLICLVYPGPGPRTGDSLEYYAMLVSWTENFRPYLTAESCASLENHLNRGAIPKEYTLFPYLKKQFSLLLKNGTDLDLPHFWFYSLCAGIFYWPLTLVSADIGFCFSLVHIVILFLAYFIIRRKMGGLAGLSLLLIVYGSPLLWFSNKVHTEFLTVVLTILATALFSSENYVGAALVLAIVSTQNPPFAILAFLVFLFGLAREKQMLFKNHFFLWVIAGLIALLHPLYYFFRHGFLNPVVGGGGANLERDAFSLKKIFCFLVDPDIGLFANWLLSLLLLGLFVVLMVRKKAGLGGRVWLFLALSVPIFLWSQSRTANVNHGGTIDISRYALWYLFVFFLFIWQICLFLSNTAFSSRRIFSGFLIALGIVQVILFWPTKAEQYLRPTWVSRLLYDHLPGVYDPFPEIFIERQYGRELLLPWRVWAVSTPSGNKIYVQRNRMIFRRIKNICMIETCPRLDFFLVYKEAEERFAREPEKKFLYINGRGRLYSRPEAVVRSLGKVAEALEKVEFKKKGCPARKKIRFRKKVR